MGESPVSASGLFEELRHTPGAASGTGGDAADPRSGGFNYVEGWSRVLQRRLACVHDGIPQRVTASLPLSS